MSEIKVTAHLSDVIQTTASFDTALKATADFGKVLDLPFPLKIEQIGSWTGTLATRTSTSAQNTDTHIPILQDKEYLYYVATIECDGELDTSSANNWGGLTVCLGSRYTKSNTGRYYTACNLQYRGTVRPYSWSDVSAQSVNPINSASYGVYATNNTVSFAFSRKCHATNCPKIMGGTYTVNVYGVKFNLED